MPPTTHLPARTLSVSGLALRRGERLLFDDVGFTVEPGEILLLRGPNGAGKTSLIKCLAGFLRADEGSVVVSGQGEEERWQEDVHFLGHLSAVKARLKVGENLGIWAAVNGGGGSVEAALERVGLGALFNLDAGYLSAGQTRRLALARLLVSPRPIWLLDEPTSALDKAGDRLVGELIDGHLASGGLAVAATHLELQIADTGRIRMLELGA
ncbi:heme ABC exporter ATP-binding protein CcmA [Paradevosia shaoguanensis]|uniref:Heme ABC exporter ATP-binding protein CcmA n=1 Tax=Paradevosia shaoguanensis TaxID=1335043 RepID=A0AA41UCZ3_9HYPH|nr:heme ABC exporter ATP-binding protein CcmA [Paradevosia shaoguanensis]MCF1744665.1 heme ABC exporter ATP-binding protein CcmA [Paradevosia shaoguanensis]MCI0129148.1 heme ABC exporter ATP-binding protein CcmA [Paradevosia shaoguanensis]